MKNLRKRIRFSAIVHLQKAPITTSSDSVPDSENPLIGENIIIYSNKTFKVQKLFAKIQFYLSFFMNIRNHGKNYHGLK